MGIALLTEQAYRVKGMEPTKSTSATLLAQRDVATFEQVFKTNFKGLHSYAFSMIKDEDEAEEIVQQVFFKLWERNEKLDIAGPVNAYLYRAVHNESLNYLKHQKVKAGHQLHVAYSMKNEVELPSKKITATELENKIHTTLNELPEQCRTIFQLSRFSDLKYREIADRLNISVKTVENQMGKALKILRIKLADFLLLIVIIFIFKY